MRCGEKGIRDLTSISMSITAKNRFEHLY